MHSRVASEEAFNVVICFMNVEIMGISLPFAVNGSFILLPLHAVCLI
jgi:hypothetical protein